MTTYMDETLRDICRLTKIEKMTPKSIVLGIAILARIAANLRGPCGGKNG
jgi:hypothetical protein